MAAVKAVGHGVLAAHRAVVIVLLLRFFLVRNGAARDRKIELEDFVEALCEGNLQRTADLAVEAAFQRAFGGNHLPKIANIEVGLAQRIPVGTVTVLREVLFLFTPFLVSLAFFATFL